jgi:hypothetical protein
VRHLPCPECPKWFVSEEQDPDGGPDHSLEGKYVHKVVTAPFKEIMCAQPATSESRPRVVADRVSTQSGPAFWTKRRTRRRG